MIYLFFSTNCYYVLTTCQISDSEAYVLENIISKNYRIMLEKSSAKTVEVANIWSFQNRFDFNFVFIFQGKNRVIHIFILREIPCIKPLQGNRFTWNVLWISVLTYKMQPGARLKEKSVHLLGKHLVQKWSGMKGRILGFIFCILIKHRRVTMDLTAVLRMFHLDSLKASQ